MNAIATKTYRIGVQTLYRDGQRYVIAIRNRTYASRIEISRERAMVWFPILTGEAGEGKENR